MMDGRIIVVLQKKILERHILVRVVLRTALKGMEGIIWLIILLSLV